MTWHVLKIVTLLDLLGVLVGCAPANPDPEKYRNRFYDNEEKFTTLVAVLQADPLTYNCMGRTLFWKAFANPTKKGLQELGITHVHIYSWTEEGMHMELKTNWRANPPVHLYYNTYKEAPGQMSYYEEETNCGELWPLIKHWMLRLKRKCPVNSNESSR